MPRKAAPIEKEMLEVQYVYRYAYKVNYPYGTYEADRLHYGRSTRTLERCIKAAMKAKVRGENVQGVYKVYYGVPPKLVELVDAKRTS